MREVAYTIGNNPQLVGVYTQAEKTTSGKKLPTILFFNSGLLPRMGPFRLYVRLARKFAELGFNSFRFDLSGIGDSERHNDNRQHEERHMGDLRAVIEFLAEKEQDSHFIVVGICTGADNAHKAMVKESRIVGAVSIDGYTYPTMKYYYNLYLPKLVRLKSWLTLCRLIMKRIKAGFKPARDPLAVKIDYGWQMPPKAKTESDYKEFIRRDVNLLSIFTASWRYNYANQLADAFSQIKFGKNIQTAFLQDAEHIFPLAEDRKILTATIERWLVERFID